MNFNPVKIRISINIIILDINLIDLLITRYSISLDLMSIQLFINGCLVNRKTWSFLGIGFYQGTRIFQKYISILWLSKYFTRVE